MNLSCTGRDAVATRRNDPRHYTPADLPADFAAFETPVAGLDVGHPGKVGLLEIDFAALNGTTRIVRQFQQLPLQVFRPLYLDPHRPEMAFVYVMSHGGTVQGDRYRLDLSCGPATSVHVTTQSAAKLYRMESNYATQMVRLTAGAGSFLEYLPDPIIPFRGTRYFCWIQLTAHPTASVILGEVLLPGRVAYGECHDYTLYASRLEARSCEGKLLFSDALTLGSRRGSPHSPGRLGAFTSLANLYVVTQQVPAHLLSARLHERLAEFPDVLGGASELPNDSGVWVRVLGASSLEVSSALHALWDEARRALIGVPAPLRRKT